MMNKQIRSMVDEIFSDMKMTAENLALRDELMANAQARYEDMIAQGKNEGEAAAEVAASLEDVCGLLDEMKRMDDTPKADREPAKKPIPELTLGDEADEEAKKEEKAEKAEPDGAAEEQMPQTDLGDALNKAFTALGDFGQAIMPEARKIYDQVDEVTGGVLGKLGRAAKRGMRDAQKAAEEAIDKLSGENGGLVFDFGANKDAGEQDAMNQEAENAEEGNPDDGNQDAASQADANQADVNQADVNQEAAREEQQADAQDDLEAAMEAARREAERAVQEAEQEAEQGSERETEQGAEQTEEGGEDAEEEQPDEDAGEDDAFDEEAFARSVEHLTHEAEEVLHEAAQAARDAADYIVRGEDDPVSGEQSFPAAGLHRVDIQLDADDVEIVPTDGSRVETLWEAKNTDSEPVVTLNGHTLTIRRKNPDVFKTFFSVFQQAGGKLVVRVPRGYAAGYAITTTSGDVRIGGLDVEDVKVNTASGNVRVEPDAKTRAGDIDVTTVSGHATVSACAETISVTTVSGGQFISCDASKVDVNVVSGKVHVEGACDEWEVSAVSSDVELLCTVAPTKKVQISSVYGDVHLALPEDIRGFVAQSSGALGCEIVNEFGPNRYGTCGLPIRMETLRGKLIITRL